MGIKTSVTAHFNGSHVDPGSGVLHGHDYVVRATWNNTRERFEALKDRLCALLGELDHKHLPDGIWSAEDLAPWLLARLDCQSLSIERPVLGHLVEVNK